MSMLEDVKKVFQELIVPELQQIKTDGQLIKVRMDGMEREMNGRFNAVDQRLVSLEREFNARFDTVDQRFNAVDQRLSSMQRDLDSAIDLHERIATLEAKLAAR